MKYLKDQQGVTLIELLVGIALLAVVIGLAFNYYNVGASSFEVGERRTNMQQVARLAADNVIEELRYAKEIEIEDSKSNFNNEEDGWNYFYFTDGNLMLKEYYYCDDKNEVKYNKDDLFEPLTNNVKFNEDETNYDFNEDDNILEIELEVKDAQDDNFTHEIETGLALPKLEEIEGQDENAIGFYAPDAPEHDFEESEIKFGEPGGC